MKIVVTPPFTEEQKALILSAAERPEDVIFCLKSDMTEELLREADVLLGNLESPGPKATACREGCLRGRSSPMPQGHMAWQSPSICWPAFLCSARS